MLKAVVIDERSIEVMINKCESGPIRLSHNLSGKKNKNKHAKGS